MKVDQGDSTILDSTKDIHILTGALKLFFRELQEPLIPWDAVERLHIITTLNDEFDETDKITECLASNPIAHQATLYVLLKHLHKVAQFGVHNRMELPTLALIFGPTVMTPPLHLMASQMQLGMRKQSDVLEALLQNFENLYPEELTSFLMKRRTNSLTTLTIGRDSDLKGLKHTRNSMMHVQMPQAPKSAASISTVDERY